MGNNSKQLPCRDSCNAKTSPRLPFDEPIPQNELPMVQHLPRQGRGRCRVAENCPRITQSLRATSCWPVYEHVFAGAHAARVAVIGTNIGRTIPPYRHGKSPHVQLDRVDALRALDLMADHVDWSTRLPPPDNALPLVPRPTHSTAAPICLAQDAPTVRERADKLIPLTGDSDRDQLFAQLSHKKKDRTSNLNTKNELIDEI